MIAITRFEASALAKMADYCLNVASTELMFRSGAMSSRISQLNMVDILYSAYVNKHYDENLEKISKTYIDKEALKNILDSVRSEEQVSEKDACCVQSQVALKGE